MVAEILQRAARELGRRIREISIWSPSAAQTLSLARLVLLETHDVNDDEAVEAIARAIAKEAGWALTAEALANPRALVESENSRTRLFVNQAVAAIKAQRALIDMRTAPEDRVVSGEGGNG